MRLGYLLYPGALEKLKSSGIEARVEKLKNSEEGIPYIGGAMFQDEIREDVKYLKENGFYKNIPSDFSQTYAKTMNGILNKDKYFSWKINEPTVGRIVSCELGDMLLFSGIIASMVLNPEEIWDYSRFGFSSPSELITTTSKFIIDQSKGLNYREGYTWATKRKDGSEILTEISGSNHSDMRIYQTDIAAHPTIDPFNNPIEMRPKNNRSVIAAYHSTEGSLLVATLKYIEQQGIKTEFEKDNARQLVEWGRSLGQSGGTCTEHLGGFDKDPTSFFYRYGLQMPQIKMPQLNSNNEAQSTSNFEIFIGSENAYAAYISNNGELVLSYQNTDTIKNPKKPISMKFLPGDAEHLVKGLIYQSAKGLGRTSAKQLLDILGYRYSEQFQKDKERLNKK